MAPAVTLYEDNAGGLYLIWPSRHSATSRSSGLSRSYIRLDWNCSRCESGRIVHPDWEAWSERWPAARLVDMGAHRREASRQLARVEEPQVPEEVPCPDCKGSGYVLTSAGEKVLEFMRRHGQ
jgi:hypothetical protein